MAANATAQSRSQLPQQIIRIRPYEAPVYTPPAGPTGPAAPVVAPPVGPITLPDLGTPAPAQAAPAPTVPVQHAPTHSAPVQVFRTPSQQAPNAYPPAAAPPAHSPPSAQVPVPEDAYVFEAVPAHERGPSQHEFSQARSAMEMMERIGVSQPEPAAVREETAADQAATRVMIVNNNERVRPAAPPAPTPQQPLVSQAQAQAAMYAEPTPEPVEPTDAEQKVLALAETTQAETPAPRRPAVQSHGALATRDLPAASSTPKPIAPSCEPASLHESLQAACERYADVQPAAYQPAREELPFADERGTFTGPFEVIEQTGELTVRLRQNKLLRTRFDIYRTAVVDSSICEVVQFTPREVAILGKAQGATQVTFWFDDGEHRPVTYLVRVQPDPEERRRHEDQFALLEELLRELFPDSDVNLLPMADKLVIRGQAKDSAEASQILAIIRQQVNQQTQNYYYGTLSDGMATDVLFDDETGRMAPQIQVINLLQVPGVQQVALRVKIAELNRTAARGMGVDVAANIDIGGTSHVLIDSLLNVAAGNPPALIGALDGNDLEIGLRYLSQHGVVRMLSEPTLVTLSGRPATFVAGGEFAVPTVVGVGGASAVTTDFRSFGAVVSFLPVVLDKDRVRLEVAPEFSQINENLSVGDTPGLNVRAVTTTVEMREGQTLAIAGLLDDSMSGNTAGDLPIVSQIFGRRDITHSETELIILVTPELVSPMEPEEVPPLPGFDVTEPTNKEFYCRGELEGRPTQEYRSTVWPHLRRRYGAGGPSMISGPFGHGQ